MAMALPIMAGVSTVAGMYTSWSSGMAQVRSANAASAAATYNADVASNNAAYAKSLNSYQTTINSDQEMENNQQNASQVNSLTMRNIALLGAQRATAAGNGVVLSGTFNDLAASSTMAGEMDARNAQYSGQMKNWAIDIKTQSDTWNSNQMSTNLTNQSSLDMSEAANDRSAAATDYTNTIFNTIGAAASGSAKTSAAVDTATGSSSVAPIFQGGGQSGQFSNASGYGSDTSYTF